MASKELIPIQAGDSSTNPNLQESAMVPFDSTDGVDLDMGLIMELGERNVAAEEESQQALVPGSSSYGPAPLPPPPVFPALGCPPALPPSPLFDEAFWAQAWWRSMWSLPPHNEHTTGRSGVPLTYRSSVSASAWSGHVSPLARWARPPQTLHLTMPLPADGEAAASLPRQR